MDFDDFLNPHRPLLDEVEVLNALYDAAEPERLIKQFTPVFRNLFEDDRDLYENDQPQDLAGQVRRFLDRVCHLSTAEPAPEELDRAPVLHGWCAVRMGTSPFLLGQSTGHPILRWGARTRTSVLMQISLDHSWARTWNRYYSLSEYNRETLFAMQADGKIPPAVELIPINDKLY